MIRSVLVGASLCRFATVTMANLREDHGAAFGRFSSRLRAVWISLTAYRIKTQQAAGILENTDGFALSPQNVPL